MASTEPGASVRQVLMTADAVGGVWTYALDLARALGSQSVRVGLALMGPPASAAQREELAAVENATLYERPYALEWMDEPWADVDAAGQWLLELEGELQPDVVHLNGYCHAALDWHAPVLVTGHSCVLSWWRAVHGSDAPARWDTYAGRVADGLRSADLVVAPTASMLAMLDYHYGPLGRTQVIANGRDVAYGAYDAAQKDPIVLTAGRLWDQAKNVESVVACAPYLPWPVYVAGETRHPSGAAVTYRGVHCLGRLSSGELAAWMCRAGIYALPARYEPFGLSILEAALAGCALVLGDIRSQREIWGEAAIFVPPDNRRALAAAIERLADDDGMRHEMARRATARARQLTPQRMGSGYYAAYRALVRESLPMSA